MDKIKIRQAVIVEGKYDKIKISSFLDATIIETRGFRIFSDKEQMKLLRVLARQQGLLVLTDSDHAGFMIRNYLAGSIPKEQIRHAYIPDILGKEKRKKVPSKEGKLGVEGVSVSILLDSLRKAGVLEDSPPDRRGEREISKADLFEDGLTGVENSAARREKLLKRLALPAYLSPNALVRVLNMVMSYDEYKAYISQLDKS